MAGYIGSKAVITSGISASIDELNLIDGVTATTAELNYNDTGAAVGVVVASKTVTADANKDVASLRNVTATGVATVGSVVVADGGNIGAASDTDSLSIASNGVVTFSQAPVFPDGSLNLADLDIDGGTDIGAALVDADLMIVDDGAGGTNRKATMARLSTYMATKIGGGMDFLGSSGAISDAATVQFTSKIDASKYDSYKFFFHSVLPATDGATLVGELSANNGTAYDSTNGNYHMLEDGAAGVDNRAYLQITREIDDSAFGGYSGEVQLLNAGSSSSNTLLVQRGVYTHNSGTDFDYRYSDKGGAYVASTAAHNAIRFKFGSGNIASGEITMFGVVNS